MAKGRYEIRQNEAGEYSFQLITFSGTTLAHSGYYKTLSVCKKGIASLRINSDAQIDDRSEDALTLSEPLRYPKIKIFCIDEHETGGYNFTVHAKNGNIIATGEGYGTKKRCLEAISNLKYIAFSAESSIV